MTISSQTRIAGPFPGTGAIVPYPFSFKVFATADVLATLTDASGNQTPWTLGGNYTVTLNGDQNVAPGGTLTPLAAVPVGSSLLLTSAVSATQPASLTNTGGFYPKTIEDALDRLTILIQQTNSAYGTTLRVPEATGIPTLPPLTSRLGVLLGFDSAGNPAAYSLANAPQRAFQKEKQTAVAGQLTYTFTQVSYLQGLNSLFVYVNGTLVTDYVETSTTSVTFLPGVVFGGEDLLFVGGAASNNSAADAATVAYVPTGAVGFSQSLQAKLGLDAPMPEDFGAYGDGASHPLSTRFATLVLAQAKFPNAIALTDEIDGTVIQYLCNLGIKWRSRQSSSSIYLTTYGIDAKHGTRAYGAGQWTATATVSKNTSTSEIKYVGAAGANTYVLKIADQAMGVDPTGSPSTRDMQNCAFRDWTLNANGLAAFGLVEVRAWAGNDLDNLTMTGATRFGNWAVQCWDKGPRGRVAAFNQGAAFNWGENLYGWANTTTVDQASPQDCIAYYNGCDAAGNPLNQFNETTGAALNYGFGIFGSRALTLVNCQSLNNDGVGIYLNTTLSPVTFLGGYVEGNSRSSQIVKVDNFVGNGATVAYVLSNAFGNASYVVTVGGVTKTKGTDYNVVWAAGVSTLTFTVAPANAAAIVVTYNRQWVFWNKSTATSWAIKADGMEFGLSPSHRMTGTAPSRLSMGFTFANCPLMGEVLADWNAWNMINCDQTAVITGTAPGTPIMSVGGFSTDVGTSNAGFIVDRVRGASSSFTFGGTTADGTGWAYGAGNLFTWRRIGNMVFFSGCVQITTAGTGTTGGLLLRGLPYAALNGFGYDSPVTISQIGNLTTAVVSMTGVVRNNTSQIELYIKTAAAVGDSAMALANISNTTIFRVSGHYITNDA